jgi:hypothetical protein
MLNVSQTGLGEASSYRSSGMWKLDAKGFCTTWQNAQRACFTVIPNGENKWSIQKGANVIAKWTK